MYDNQLDFSGKNANNYFIYSPNLREDNQNEENYQRNDQYIEDLRNYQIEGHLMNQNSNNFVNYPEQLDYMLNKNLNEVIQRETATPLVFKNNQHYNKNKLHLKNKKINFKNGINNFQSRLAKVKSTIKNGLKHMSKSTTSFKHTPTINTNWNTNIKNANGLFDPGLKKNELDTVKKSQIQRIERDNKIKTYDMKFGNKLKKIEMYNNYMDVLEDMENKGAEFEFAKKQLLKQKNQDKLKLEKINNQIYELEKKLPQPLKITANNLNFDFSAQEQLIKSLEEQIEMERKMRTEINMKYFNKMKEFEELKYKQLSGQVGKSNVRVSDKSRQLINRYSSKPVKTRAKSSNSKFKKSLNQSANMVRIATAKPTVRLNSADKIKEKMKLIKPEIDNMIDKTFNDIYKGVIDKNKTMMRNIYSKSRPQTTKNFNYNNMNIEMNQNENLKENLNLYSPLDNKNIPLSPKDTMMMSNPCSDNHSHNQQLQSDMITKLNKEIDSYSKGLPKLIEKVESTLEKININNNPLLNDKLHPLIKMASKVSGQVIHLHLDEIVELIIDDFLFECVDELQAIERKENKMREQASLKIAVKNYYHNFKNITNFEQDLNQKLESKNYFTVEQIKAVNDNADYMEKEIQFKTDSYTNPFQQKNVTILTSLNKFLINKYTAKLHPALYDKIEDYSKNYLEHMKTTGAFYFPNIFVLYDQLTNELVNEVLNDQLDFCMKELDNFVSDVYKEEVFNLNQ
jgi:hypothetical protein